MASVATRVFDNPRGRGIIQFVRDEQRRVHLSIGGETAFEATPDTCDTCRYLFTKLRHADSLKDAADPDLVERIRGLLKDVREMPDELALAEVASILEPGRYTAAPVSLVPQLTMPGDEHDYFAHEAVETWGLDPYYGAPHSPRTAYYRLGSTPLRNHRLGVVLGVPLHPPTARGPNHPALVDSYARLLREGETRPTALAVATVDDRGPAVWTVEHPPFHRHLIVTLWLLDGHHKVAAASGAGLPLQFLVLLPHAFLGRVEWDLVREGVDLLERVAAS